MADKKISQLTDGTSLQSGDFVVIARSGDNFKVDPTQFGSDISLGDNVKATFGDSSDLEIYHDGSNSYIKEGGTGDLLIRGANVEIQTAGGVNYFQGASGFARLYHTGDERLVTTGAGIIVTGTVAADGLTVDAAFSSINYPTVGGIGPTLRLENTSNTADAGNGARLEFVSGDNPNRNAYIETRSVGTFGRNPSIVFGSEGDGGGDVDHVLIADNGDISFYEDTGTTPKFFWDASAEALGIGTISPATALDVVGTVTADALAVSNLKIDSEITTTPTNDGANYIFRASSSHPDYNGGDLIIQARSSASRDIYMLTGTTTPVNRLKVDGNGDISFYEDTGTTPTFFWDASAESLGIGTTSPDGTLHVLKENNYNGTDFVDAPHALLDNGTVTNHTAVLVFNSSGVSEANKKSGITGGNYYTNNHGLAFFGDISGKDRTATPDVFINDSGNVGIGTTSPGAKLEVNGDIIADGIYLGGTGAANLLDDYEEGTWTPEMADATTGGNTGTASINGSYTKIGRVVTLNFSLVNINTSGMTAGNTLFIRNLPFASLSGVASSYNGTVYMNDVTITSGTNSIVFDLLDGNTYGAIRLLTSASGAGTILVSDVTGGSADLRISITYTTS